MTPKDMPSIIDTYRCALIAFDSIDLTANVRAHRTTEEKRSITRDRSATVPAFFAAWDFKTINFNADKFRAINNVGQK